jgi:hypothetical protein
MGWSEIATLVAGTKYIVNSRTSKFLTFECGSKLLRIGRSAVACCLNLQSVCIPASVEVLGPSCFHACNGLQFVTFEKGCGLQRIEETAFDSCVILQSICILSSVEFLGRECFNNCQNLETVTFEDGSHLSQIEE